MEENLGNILRRARESAGLTVDDAVYLAKLPRAVVKALEENDFGFFNSPLYARSFLKQYGDYVNLDVSPWMGDLVPTTMIDGDSANSIIEIEEVAPPILSVKKKRRDGEGSMAHMWLIVISLGLVWGVILVFNDFENKHAKTPSPIQKAAAKPDELKPVIKNEKDEIKALTIDEPAPRPDIVREE